MLIHCIESGHAFWQTNSPKRPLISVNTPSGVKSLGHSLLIFLSPPTEGLFCLYNPRNLSAATKKAHHYINDGQLLIVTKPNGGGKRDRTDDLLHAMQALSQLSYTPTGSPILTQTFKK